MVPQAMVMNAIQREGRSFLMTRLEGSLGGGWVCQNGL